MRTSVVAVVSLVTRSALRHIEQTLCIVVGAFWAGCRRTRAFRAVRSSWADFIDRVVACKRAKVSVAAESCRFEQSHACAVLTSRTLNAVRQLFKTSEVVVGSLRAWFRIGRTQGTVVAFRADIGVDSKVRSLNVCVASTVVTLLAPFYWCDHSSLRTVEASEARRALILLHKSCRIAERGYIVNSHVIKARDQRTGIAKQCKETCHLSKVASRD